MSQTYQKENAGAPGDARIASYDGWTVFAHPRVGFKLPVPPGFKAAGGPEVAAQSRFVSEDGTFVMTAWGGFSPSPSRIMDWQWRQAQSVSGRTISVQRKDQTGFVVSGVDRSGTKFFQKFLIRGDRLATYTLTYPRAGLQDFDSLVSKVEGGFLIAAKIDPAWASPPVPQTPAPNLSPQQDENIDLTPPSPGSSQREFREYLSKDERTRLNRDSQKGPEAAKLLPMASESLEPPPQKISVTPVVAAVENTEIPYASPVAGKPGFVYSPYQKNELVDAVDIPRGTKVKCPYTGKIFRVP